MDKTPGRELGRTRHPSNKTNHAGGAKCRDVEDMKWRILGMRRETCEVARGVEW